MRNKALSVLALCFFSFATLVRAETPQDTADARALAIEGQREFSLGDYQAALDLLQRSYKKHPLPALLYNVAQCHRLLGHLEQARRVYKAFLDAAPNSPVAGTARENMIELEAALKAQSAAEHAAPETLARTEKAPADDADQSLSPAPSPAIVDNKAARVAVAVEPPAPAPAPVAPPPRPSNVVAGEVPPAALQTNAQAQPAHGTSWGYWIAGGAAVVAVGVIVGVLVASSGSKSVGEPSGVFNGR